MHKKLYKKIIAVQAISMIAVFGFVQSAFAGYSDVEISADNSIGASSLDAEVVSSESELQLPIVAENMLSGDSVTRTASIQNVGEIDFQYNVSFAKVDGNDELCESLQLAAKAKTTSEEVVYTGNLSGFDFDAGTLAGSGTITDDWTFTVTAPEDVPMGKDCSFKFIYTAWQTGFSEPTQGWVDTEEIDNNIIHTGVQTPMQTGYNVNDESDANSYPTPRYPDDNEFACTGGVTNINGVSVHWTDVAHGNSDVKYQRQYKVGSGSWSGNEIYPKPYTNYRTFGSGNGNDGTYSSRVRAFVEVDGDRVYSEWSNECFIEFDGTAPEMPAGLQRIAPNEDDKIYECGEISKIQKMHPDWADNEENDFSHYEYTSFNAPHGAIGLKDERMDDSIFAYNGTWLPHDGTYGFAVRAVDNAGNKSDWALTDKTLDGSCKITYDSISPDVEITAPSDNGFVSGEVDILGTVEDAHPHHYNLSLNPDEDGTCDTESTWDFSKRIWQASGGDEQSFSHELDTTQFDDGSYILRLAARDALGNRDPMDNSGTGDSVDYVCITIDNTPPATPEVLGFLDPSLSCGAITDIHDTTVDWSDSTDANGISGYQYSVDYPLADGSGRGKWSAMVNNSQYSGKLHEGIHYIEVRAKDNAGNYSGWSNTCSITADWTAPEITIEAIKYPDGTIEPNKFVTHYDTPTIVGDVFDMSEVVSVVLTVDGNDYDAGDVSDGVWEVYIEDSLSDGLHMLSVEAEDIVGNIATQEKDIFIDTVAPNAEHTFYKDGDKVEDFHVYYEDGHKFTGPLVTLDTNNLSRLSFTGEYTDSSPSAGLYWDSYAIFEAQDDGSFRFSHDDKKAFCSWRREPNLVDISDEHTIEHTISLTEKEKFNNCEETLPDGEYYIAHHIYDYATRLDIPSINHFRDVLGLHFKIDAPPEVPTGISILDHNDEDLGCDGKTDNRSITIDWDDNDESDIDHYDYRIREGNVIAHPEISKFSGDIRNEDGDYKYSVRVVDKSGNKSDWTDWCHVELNRSDEEDDDTDDGDLDSMPADTGHSPKPVDTGRSPTPSNAEQGNDGDDESADAKSYGETGKDNGDETVESIDSTKP